jgi:mRNA-degrading endonuclease RelE of RelBE toxin-antitoxin system
MAWTVEVKEEAVEHLKWFGKKTARLLLARCVELLELDPLAESRNMKTLRPNPVADRELRIWSKYRILFNVNLEEEVVTVVLVGEKRGRKLLVRGEEFEAHESDSAK